MVVLEGGPPLPEGTVVTVSCPDAALPKPDRQGCRVSPPPVPSKRPGSLPLTAERAAELLGETDVPS